MGKDGQEGEDGRQAHLGDYQVETEGLESGSAGNSSGGHCFEGHLDEGELEPETQAGRSHIFFQNTKNFEWNLAKILKLEALILLENSVHISIQ